MLISPNSDIYYGNSNSQSNKRDELNNNEQILIEKENVITGDWKVHIQSKILLQNETQSFSLVITADGEVDITNPHLKQDINPLNIDQCTYENNAISKNIRLDVSLWSMARWDGWSSKDKYTLTATDNSTIHQATMSLQDKYYLDTTCIQSGCYKANLVLSTSSVLGTYMSIPQCNNLYLTSLHKQQEFCINNDLTSNSNSVTCKSSCFNSAHVIIPMLLFEGGGEGWSSNYYLIDTINEDTNGLVTTSSISAGTLEWDFSKNDDICLPISNTIDITRKCYLIQLNFVEPLYDPGIFFPNSKILITDDASIVDDPVTISNDDNMIPNKDEVQNLCPYNLGFHNNATVAIICVDDELNKSNISFYYDNNGLDISRQLNLYWDSSNDRYVSNKLTHYGTCQTVTNNKTPTSTPTVFPTEKPTLLPTTIPTAIPSDIPTFVPTAVLPTSIPTSIPSVPSSSPSKQPTVKFLLFPTSSPSNLPSNLPTSSPSSVPHVAPTSYPSHGPILFKNNNLTCFNACNNYDKLYDVTQLNDQLCFFLLSDIYRGCNSYSISTGTCNRPICARECSMEDWCYFATEAVFMCERQVDWISSNNALNEFQSSCINYSLKASDVNDDDINERISTSNDNEISSYIFSSSAFQAIIVFIVLILFLFILYNLIKQISKTTLQSKVKNGDKTRDYEVINFDKQIDTEDVL